MNLKQLISTFAFVGIIGNPMPSLQEYTLMKRQSINCFPGYNTEVILEYGESGKERGIAVFYYDFDGNQNRPFVIILGDSSVYIDYNKDGVVDEYQNLNKGYDIDICKIFKNNGRDVKNKNG